MSAVKVFGVEAPIIRQGDDIAKIVMDSLDGWYLNDKDVIGITESVVARAQGNYVTVDDIVQFLDERAYSKKIVLCYPIMSRNRFSVILRAFARYADELAVMADNYYDEQGNPTRGINPFTGVNIKEYYQDICKEENCKFTFFYEENVAQYDLDDYEWLDCKCHPDVEHYASLGIIGLCHIMSAPVTRKDGTVSGYNESYGLLGSNKADEELLKLFPDPKYCEELVNNIQGRIQGKTGKLVEVMVYGDGCFKDPSGIWEFADPVTSPGYTKGLEGTPNEVKVKYLVDSKYKNLSGEELNKALKQEIEVNKGKDLVGSMTSQGTTPRRYVDLLASLMDLTSGSGSRCTPFVLVQNYFE